MRKWAKNAFNELKEEIEVKRQGEGSVNQIQDQAQRPMGIPPPIPPNKPSHLRADPTDSQSITSDDIVRYRYQHGANLGSIFVLEKWMFGSMYEQSAKGASELDAATAAVKSTGLEQARAKFEAHWQNALTDADFKFLTQTAHVTTIRLPIGYFTLGPRFTQHTPFAGQVGQVYTNAWQHVVSIISRCASHGIGILIDFHALPGGANNEGHSGTSNGKAELWKSTANQNLALQCLTFVAQEIESNSSIPQGSVTGLQLCNEAAWAAPNLYSFYDQCIQRISAISPSLPIYISDAWNLSTCLPYVAQKNSLQNSHLQCPVVVDTHKYYTFAEEHRSKAPQELISSLESVDGQFPSLSSYTNKSIFDTSSACPPLFIGEWSVTLDTRTWSRVDSSQRAALTRSFGLAQSQLWHKHTIGSTYWSYKFDWGGPNAGRRGLVHTEGGDWGFRNQVDNHNITPPPALTLSRRAVNQVSQNAMAKKQDLKTSAYDSHVNYWNSASPSTPFNHPLYASGYDLGFSDALTFFTARLNRLIPVSNFSATNGDDEDTYLGADILAALDLWILKRMRECGIGRDRDAAGWEWEHGFRRGVEDFQGVVREVAGGGGGG